MNRLAALLACAFALRAEALTIAPPAASPYTATVRAESTVESVAGDAAPQKRTLKGLPLEQALENRVTTRGTENSPCAPAGRVSSGESTATIRAHSEKDGTLEVSAGLRTFANGGHVRICATCLASQCIGISGVDTDARASAVTEVIAEITFKKDVPKTPFQVTVRHSLEGNGITRTIAMIDGEGKRRPIPNDETIAILGGEGRTYRLLVTLKSESTDRGACCEDEKKGNFLARVVLTPAPQLVASVFNAANRTPAYQPAVGLLVTRGKRGEPVPACTGTVIGQRTILTAAHCLEFYTQKAELLFVPGNSLASNSHRAVRIVDWVRPSDEFPGGFRYRVEKGRALDDVALLYTAEPLDIDRAALQGAEGPGDRLVTPGSPAELVTFAAVAERETKFEGEDAVKFASRAVVGESKDRTFDVQIRDSALCAGWSGAPIMSAATGSAVLIGMTIAGAEGDCNRAQALRLDAYAPWLQSRIR